MILAAVQKLVKNIWKDVDLGVVPNFFVQDSLLVRAPESWSKRCEFESQQEQWENFILQN